MLGYIKQCCFKEWVPAPMWKSWTELLAARSGLVGTWEEHQQIEVFVFFLYLFFFHILNKNRKKQVPEKM